MEINTAEKHFGGSGDMVHDFPQFAICDFSLGLSQEQKQALPEGVVIVDSQPDILVAAVQVINCDLEDVITRCMMTYAQCICTPLLPGTSSHTLAAEFFIDI